MDDKETKNIDGIKPTEDVNNGDFQSTTLNAQGNFDSSSNDVAISKEGEMAPETLEPIKTDSNQEIKLAPAEPAKEEEKLSTDDPGIVPSVQPVVKMPDVSPVTEVAKLKERNKNLKIWLVVLMLLLVGVASALVVYFAGQSKARSDLKTQQQANVKLQDELNMQHQNATQQTINTVTEQLESLKTKSTELQSTIDSQKQQITNYQTALKKILTACGSTCKDIELPQSDAE